MSVLPLIECHRWLRSAQILSRKVGVRATVRREIFKNVNECQIFENNCFESQFFKNQ